MMEQLRGRLAVNNRENGAASLTREVSWRWASWAWVGRGNGAAREAAGDDAAINKPTGLTGEQKMVEACW